MCQLLEHGADTEDQNNDFETPLDLARSQGKSRVVAMLSIVTERRETCLAFAMGKHERLGAGSRVQGLEAGVVRMVMESVYHPYLGGLW